MNTPRILPLDICFESATAQITREHNWFIRLRMRPGKQTSADIRTMFEQALKAMQRTGLDNLLVDQRQAVPFLEADKEWFATEYLPQVAANLIAYRVAIVLAYDVFARLSMVPLASNLKQIGNVFRSFEHEEEAITWLLGTM